MSDQRIVICREQTCGARIILLKTRVGRIMPVDADSVEADDNEYDPQRHKSHFVTCTAPGRFRRKR